MRLPDQGPTMVYLMRALDRNACQNAFRAEQGLEHSRMRRAPRFPAECTQRDAQHHTCASKLLRLVC